MLGNTLLYRLQDRFHSKKKFVTKEIFNITLCNLLSLQSFSGFTYFHRAHLPNYAEITVPLYEYLEDCNPKRFDLPQDLVLIIEKLKHMLFTSPVLVYPRRNSTFILNVDASDKAIGGELIQIIEGEERTITYASHKLTAAQHRYCTTGLEMK